jgi:ribonuclease Z
VNRRPELLDQGHPFRQWKTWQIPGTRLTMTGYSRANDKTFFHVPELRCALDAGLAEGRQPETVFLTHAHADHAADLAYLAARAGGVDIYLPDEMLASAQAFLAASFQLNNAAPYDPALADGLRLRGVAGGDEFTVGRRGAHSVRVVRCQHKVPCVGYCFTSVGKGLLPEYEALRATMAPADFGKLVAGRRAAGEAVDRDVRTPLFAFLGDTHPRVFDDNPWLFEYPVIVTECTYLDDAQSERADRVGHTVWSRLRPVVRAHPATLFVLTHFSLRHSDAEVLAFFDREELPNVVVWAHPDSHLPEQHQRTP